MALFSIFDGNKNSENSNTSEIDAANFRIIQLNKKLDELSSTLEALWELLVEQHQFDESALQEKISAKKSAIESRANETTNCNSCNRTVPTSKGSCYYCGAKLDVKVSE
ncbi:MAG: hypothetical protein COA71_09715 [SAR86 cluster bacterium]|uniref:Uncharacterized protein n=1 Tax=SAR86 cluster bacterium TaxID=2030880 RepID=A0A2A5CBI8_9GAMM|nr:hypothetical protein [Gammaproteobacteria bacterium AH-315-E17]PCJ40871.1 MAG: hypothetical protein COA71_09715 [SAR86 cluster bacterium]